MTGVGNACQVSNIGRFAWPFGTLEQARAQFASCVWSFEAKTFDHKSLIRIHNVALETIDRTGPRSLGHICSCTGLLASYWLRRATRKVREPNCPRTDLASSAALAIEATHQEATAVLLEYTVIGSGTSPEAKLICP